MNNYIFIFENGIRMEYMLPDNVTIRELVNQFVEDGFVIDISTSSCPEGYVLKSEGKNDIVLSKDGGDQTISELGIEPEIEYVLYKPYVCVIPAHFNLNFKEGSETVTLTHTLSDEEGPLEDGYFNKHTTMRDLVEGLERIGLICACDSISFRGCSTSKMLYLTDDTIDLTMEKFGLFSYDDMIEDYDVIIKKNIYTFEFATGSRQEYILPDDVTIRELVVQFAEDGYFGSGYIVGQRPIGYSFTPQDKHSIRVGSSDHEMDQTIYALGLRPGVIYFAAEDVCCLYGCPTSRETEGLTPDCMIEEVVELIDVEI